MVFDSSRVRNYVGRTHTAYKKRGLSYAALRVLDSRTPWSVKHRWEDDILDLYREYHSADLQQYDCQQDPFELIYVDPEKISRITGMGQPSDITSIGDVAGGGWDQVNSFENTKDSHLYRAEQFEDILLYDSLEARFRNGLDWEETEFVQEILRMVENGRAVWHSCQSAQDVMQRCYAIDDLYDNIRTGGYTPYRDLKRGTDNFLLRLYANEILVDVDRRGELLIADGFHRLSIAKILELDRIPTLIRVRHQGWIKNRCGTPYGVF